ncbi:MAG: hypothetical protein LBS19_14470 [Clostridiales bacterium]|jgi:hypothetical protein|nr:hypothetical protein [Clostridiales bacterium]
MSDVCYFIGIGGTGGRVARGLLHLCDCGYLKNVRKLKMLVIDSDKRNGNKTKLEEALDLYVRCRNDLYGDGGGGADDLFNTKIERVPGLNSWSVSPVESNNKLARHYLNDYVVDENVAEGDYMMRLLYNQHEREQLDMGQGFFAHPSLGSFAFYKWVEKWETDNSEFNYLLRDIGTELGSSNVKVFIVGSAFGGTGASGFPAVAQAIQARAKALMNVMPVNRLVVAGALYMPYFTVTTNLAATSTVDFDEFAKATKRAMDFYETNSDVGAFNRVYAIGAAINDGKIERNENYDEGGEKQDNWPHMLELFGALASKEVFEADLMQNADLGAINNPWHGIGVDKAFREISWRDLPTAGDENGLELKKRLNNFILLSSVFIPAFVSKFMEEVQGSADWDFKRVRSVRESFRPILRQPFLNTALRMGQRNRSWNNDETDAVRGPIMNMNRYFELHATWFCRLLHEFKPEPATAADEKYGNVIFTNLVGSKLIKYKAENPLNGILYTGSGNNLGTDLQGRDGAFDYGELAVRILNNADHDLKGKYPAALPTVSQMIRRIYKICGSFL